MVARWWEKPARRSPAVFVSHASADSRQVAVVVDVLEGAGLPCWVAPRDIQPGSERSCPVSRAVLPGTAGDKAVSGGT
jgi:hypothetical protein